MQDKNPQSRESRYRSTYRSIIHDSPRIRRDNSADLADLRLAAADADLYGSTEAEGYLGSSSIAETRRKRKRKRTVTIVILSVVAALLIAAIAVFAYLGNISNKLTGGLDSSLYSELIPVESGDPFYVLLLGTDRSAEREADEYYADSFRSDSMMLARIDPKDKKVSLISIPRDLKVELEGYGEEKINAAHYYGGPTLAVKTVSKLAGVPISHYAEIEMNGFASVVDALGGIEVDVPIEIDDPEAGGHLAAGLQTLDGSQALILCRSRHSYDDYGAGDLYRAANQRVVLGAIAQKLLESDLPTIASSIDSLADSVMTDMDVRSIIGIAQGMQGLDAANDVYSGVVPTESEYENDIWYEILDRSAWKTMMKRVEEGLSPTEKDIVDEETGTVLSSTGNGSGSSGERTYKVDKTQSINIRNGNGTEGISSDAQDILKQMGYRLFDVGNADSFDYKETIVIYKNEDDEDAAEDIVDALGHGEAILDDGTYLFESDFLVIIGADWSL